MKSNNASVYVVIPTFNEAENIAALIKDLLNINTTLQVVVVDDNSPDGTGKIVDEVAANHKRVNCIHRQGKGGRGAACLAGFHYALDNGADLVFEMDADYSHDPNEIPLFLDKIQDYDMVLGSRYAKQSEIVNWGIMRRIFSRFANAYAKFFLRIPITDYTNGYRCYRKRTFDFISYDEIDAKGYIVLSEVAVQLYRKGLAIGEIPTRFVNRTRGESNLSIKEITNAFTSVLRLWWKHRGNKRPQTPPPGTARAESRE